MDKRPEETSVIPESLKYAGPMSRLARAFSGFRMASYASDVGEATRGTFPNQFVHSMYAVTISYIFVDLYFRYKDNKHLSNNKQCDSKMTEFQKYMGYHTLWHAQASLFFPTITIHSIVSSTKEFTANINWLNPKVKKFAPVVLSTDPPPEVHDALLLGRHGDAWDDDVVTVEQALLCVVLLLLRRPLELRVSHAS